MQPVGAARYAIGGRSHLGYPQPEDGWARATYESSCLRCGIHGAQGAPFRFRTEPKAGRSHFLQLNWVFDEVFVRAEVASAFGNARLSGVGMGPAVGHRTGEPLASLVQLQVETVLPPALVTDALQPVTCRPNNEEGEWPWTPATRFARDYPYCGQRKYHPPARPQFRRAAFAGAPDVVKSAEWVGSGGQAFRVLLVSERVVDLIEAHAWRGLWVKEVALVD
jgi:hypothetical protein